MTCIGGSILIVLCAACSCDLQTPLCLAVFLNQTEIVKMLIERKADVNVQLQRKLNGGLKCYRLIHYAASRGKKWVPTLIQLLSADNIDLQAFNSEGSIDNWVHFPFLCVSLGSGILHPS